MKRFIGFCNYYRNFIKNFSEIAKLLLKMTSKKEKFYWNEESLVLLKLKEILTSPPVLTKITTSNSFSNVILVITPLEEYYHKKQMTGPFVQSTSNPKSSSKAEVNYSITKKGLLTIKTAFTEWRHLLQSAKHKIIVYSNYRNLLFTIILTTNYNP